MRNAIILSLLLATTQAQANNCVAEKEQILACEYVLNKAGDLLRMQSDQITALQKQNSTLEEHLDYTVSELAKEKSWYNNVTYIAPLALIAGIILGTQASK